MNAHRVASLLALSLMLTSLPLAAAEPRSNAAAEIHLDAETVKRGDVQAATVPMSSLSPSLAAFATVLDPAPLALLGSEIEAPLLRSCRRTPNKRSDSALLRAAVGSSST